MRTLQLSVLVTLSLSHVSCMTFPADVDVIVRGGTVYDGSGDAPRVADVAIVGDRIVRIGDLSGLRGTREVDATGLAVAPGFINTLSWASESLLIDGRSQSDIRQGVTLEIMGEGWSMGPLNAEMKRLQVDSQGVVQYDVSWNTLGEYLETLEQRGVSCNVASFVGATTVRIHEIGYQDRAPTANELARMQDLVRQAMREGALGVGSSLIYAPAFYADTDELVALCQAAAEFGGTYISHLRSEANQLLEAVDELIEISRRSGCPAEIYHLKAAGYENWDKLDQVIAKIEAARDEGLRITTDMYTYTAGATGLNAAMPPWVQEGGYDAWVERMQDPEIRTRVIKEIGTPTDEWENLYLAAGGPENILLVGFRTESLRRYIGMTLAEVAHIRRTTPEETIVDLVIQDGSRVETVYFIMSEENVQKKVALPWMSFCSDAESLAPEGPFLESMPHPRAYGSFARLLGRYARDKQVISLPDAIRKLTSLPADNFGLRERGRLQEGFFADVVVFDPDRIQDHATYDNPHQYATGVTHVLVNGVPVLWDGDHTGATPGRVVRGPGYVAEPDAGS